MIEIIIEENEQDQRVDRFLLKLLRNDKRSNIYRYLRKKIIKVNGKRVRENDFLRLGDRIQIYLPPAVFESLSAVQKEQIIKDFDLDIVHEDDHILIVNKPAGLLTHPDQKEYKKTLSSYVNVYLKDLASRTFKPASIQRLDQNTSGLVIFAKDYETLKRLNALMRQREITKHYLTVVEGKVEGEGEIRGSLSRDEKTNRSRITRKSIPGGKEVHTRYRALRGNGRFTLLEVELLTGRTHQIRASLEAIGHPIVGDVKYGAKRHADLTHYLLHAYRVAFEGKAYSKGSEAIDRFVEKEMKDARIESRHQ